MHSTLNRRLMLDWVRDCDERGIEMPSDAAIVDRFGFTSPDQARTLLADLADRGEITLRGAGAERQILLGRVRSSFKPSARPVPTVTGTDRAVERGVEKIKAIVARSAVSAPSTSAGVRAAQASAALSATRTEPAIVAPAVEVKPAVPAPRLSRAEARQVNSRLSVAHHAELERRAGAEGVPISSYASMLLAGLLDRPGKPFLPTGALAFARDAGLPLHEFATMLMERGLRDYVSGAPSDLPWDDDVPGLAVPA